MQSKNKLHIRIPKNERNIIVRKYMDYPKFLSLITSKSLYFAKPEEFEDKIDSLFPNYTGLKTDEKFISIVRSECKNLAQVYYKLILDNLSKTYKEIPTREQIFIVFQSHLYPLILKGSNDQNINNLPNIDLIIFKIVDNYIANNDNKAIILMTDLIYERMNRCTIDTRLLNKRRALISCWHIGEYESDLMWKTYAQKDGIMIQTSFNKLTKLDYKPYLDKDASCEIGKVEYIDLIKRNKEKNSIRFDNLKNQLNSDILCHYFEKNKSFKDEHELRIVIAKDCKYMNEYINKTTGENIKIKTSLSNFIEKIVVSPFAPDYYVETLKNTLKQLKLNKLAEKVEISDAKRVEKTLT